MRYFVGLLILFVSLVSFSGCAKTQHTGRSQLMMISPAQEIQLGENASKQYKQAFASKGKLDRDRNFLHRVQTIGKRIAHVANQPSYRWEYHVVSEPKTLNAFCLPGGKIYVYTGILQAAKNDHQLATVIAHEVAHALARHGAERMSMGQLANLGGQILSIAMQGKVGANTANMINQAYGIGIQTGVMLPYSRNHEMEADWIGLKLMDLAGYDVRQALYFWQNMQRASGGKKGGSDFFSTHPSDSKRIAQIKKYIATRGR
jgi:predicted Zn-dependent protease